MFFLVLSYSEKRLPVCRNFAISPNTSTYSFISLPPCSDLEGVLEISVANNVHSSGDLKLTIHLWDNNLSTLQNFLMPQA